MRLLRFFRGAVTLSDVDSMSWERLERFHDFMDANSA